MGSSRNTSWTRKRKHGFKVLLGLSVIILIVVSGLYLLLFFKGPRLSDQAAEVSDSKLESSPAGGDKSNATLLSSLNAENPLEKVVYSHFALTRIDEIVSLRLKADLELSVADIEEKNHEMIFYFRRPNLMRRVMIQDGMRLDMGFDGQEVWAEQIGKNGLRRSLDPLPAKLLSNFRESVSVGSYLWRYESEPERFELLPEQIVGNIPCHVVAYENERLRVLTYIDALEFQEIARYEIPKDGSPEVYMSMSEHQKTGNVVLPYRISTMIDGEAYSTAVISEIEINKGLPTYIFNPSNQRYSSTEF